MRIHLKGGLKILLRQLTLLLKYTSSRQGVITHHQEKDFKCKLTRFDRRGSRQCYITLLSEKPFTRKPLKELKKPSGGITGTLMQTLDTDVHLKYRSLERLNRELNTAKQGKMQRKLIQLL